MEIFSQALTHVTKAANIARIIPLVPEVSTRRYYRLELADGSTYVGVLEDQQTATVNMPLVAAVQNFLHAHRIRVPEIYFCDPHAGVMLQQDLGDLSLMALLQQKPDQAESLYKVAITHMLSWQRLENDSICPAFKLSFDVEKLMFEFEFFITHTLLGYYEARIHEADLQTLRAEFTEIAEKLAAPQGKVFTHRDYHSRNILVVGSAPLTDQKQYIIDFQDARLGLMQYDLCSLLCDAYAPLDNSMRAKLLDFAFVAGVSVHRQTRAEFDHYFMLSAFQRLVKAMGTFGRQAALGRADFAAYLAPARKMLREISAGDEKLRNLVKILESMAAERG